MKKLLGLLVMMTIALTACGTKEPEAQVDPVVEEETSEVSWYENGAESILVNEGVISFDLEDQYFDAALEAAVEGVSQVTYNGKAYAMVEVKDGKLFVYDVPEEGKEIDKASGKEYAKVERDYTTKDVNGPELSSIKKAFDGEATIVKSKKVITGETETFSVTIKNIASGEVSEVTLDTEFNVQ